MHSFKECYSINLVQPLLSQEEELMRSKGTLRQSSLQLNNWRSPTFSRRLLVLIFSSLHDWFLNVPKSSITDFRWDDYDCFCRRIMRTFILRPRVVSRNKTIPPTTFQQHPANKPSLCQGKSIEPQEQLKNTEPKAVQTNTLMKWEVEGRQPSLNIKRGYEFLIVFF